MARRTFEKEGRSLSSGAGSPGRRTRPVLRGPAIAAGLLALALAGGCASRVTEIRKSADLERFIAGRGQPVVVDFYKAGCEHCNAFAVTLNELAREYSGRAVFAKFLLMRANGEATDSQFVERHDILSYPTVLIFVDGQERKRLVQQYKYYDYVAAIDECLASPATRQDDGGAAPGSR